MTSFRLSREDATELKDMTHISTSKLPQQTQHTDTDSSWSSPTHQAAAILTRRRSPEVPIDVNNCLTLAMKVAKWRALSRYIARTCVCDQEFLHSVGEINQSWGAYAGGHIASYGAPRSQAVTSRHRRKDLSLHNRLADRLLLRSNLQVTEKPKVRMCGGHTWSYQCFEYTAPGGIHAVGING
ncbi:hypothetical protein E2C01_041367 [Portunus trituberculatus]|uniref:Uncharacterized protein n=1 Tax=Portunus trituberculatus TaxID=210409 RepID=A0A5B7FQ89_PORTR|nr:hypothetical protein [Portunus trituberculatus]